ncbi:hypothetical protein [Xylella taiwanensis]|uniref:hypothetical protein n=1 Tax=Xylella taiwanensis TaxID=1444770 RepID=UPI001E53C488|nr:hypothetical protein [Xylella taiwanensis]MCD8457711.1 hypothetical protein [Xylella taiwanensis]UFN14508.1 hypothetical protein LPH61_04685 [Xylella taiwanensis]UFN42155.1 hypothetical protein LPH57_04935 [Xylella taiwanensis]
MSHLNEAILAMQYHQRVATQALASGINCPVGIVASYTRSGATPHTRSPRRYS